MAILNNIVTTTNTTTTTTNTTTTILLENGEAVQCYELLIGRNCKFQHKSNGGRSSLKGRLSFKLRNLITTWIKSHQSKSFTNFDRQRAQNLLCQNRGNISLELLQPEGGHRQLCQPPHSQDYRRLQDQIPARFKEPKTAVPCRNQLLVRQ